MINLKKRKKKVSSYFPIKPKSNKSKSKLNSLNQVLSLPKSFNKITIDVEKVLEPRSIKFNNIDGCFCSVCDKFYQYAESTTDDCKIVCYSCKLDIKIKNEK